MTNGSAQSLAVSEANSAVISALVPVCLQMSQNDPDRATKLIAITEATKYRQRDALMEAGWATMPGVDTPNRDLAQACLSNLDLTEV